MPAQFDRLVSSVPISDQPKILIVDYLRGLAALSVAWFHMTNGSDAWVAATGRYGHLGVEVFFVISGLVIPYSIIRTFPDYRLSDYPAFIARRMIRLEPPYVISILLVLALIFLAALLPQFRGTTEGVLDPWRFVAHLLYLVPLTEFDWLQPIYWTLAFEFLFYLSIGILFPVLAKAGNWAPFLMAVTLSCASVVALGLSPYVLLFAMGIAVFRHLILRDTAWRNCLVLGLCCSVMASSGAWLEGLVGLFVAGILTVHAKLPKIRARLASALGRLGLISYSLYLIHVPIGGRVVNMGKRFIETECQYLLLSLAALVVSIGAALVMYELVEKPAQALARRLASGRG